METRAEIKQWREARGERGWSQVYEGIYIPTKMGKGILISKQQHGWRVVEVKDLSKFQFQDIPHQEFVIDDSVKHAALRFLRDDQNFQETTGPTLDELMKKKLQTM